MTTQAFELQAVTDEELMAVAGGKGRGFGAKLAGGLGKGIAQGAAEAGVNQLIDRTMGPAGQ